MKGLRQLQHTFVTFIPEEVEDGVLYVSTEYATAIHNCACGCGLKVVTPLRPTSWSLTFDGDSVSLYPSIGNWSFPCRSHYWITNSRVEWSYDMTDDEVRHGRRADSRLRDGYFARSQPTPVKPAPRARSGFLCWFKRKPGNNK